jgi:hypothetical protein
LAGALFCINSAKKTPDIGLGRRKHGERISRDAAGGGGDFASPALQAVGTENLNSTPLPNGPGRRGLLFLFGVQQAF